MRGFPLAIYTRLFDDHAGSMAALSAMAQQLAAANVIPIRQH